MDWSEWFYYDETSPTFLRWKVSIPSGKNLKTFKIKAGDVAGSLKNNKRHTQVQLKGVNYFNHIVIWKIFNGDYPCDMVVDHKDGNEQNNFISNLRLVTKTVNMRNQKKPSNNTSGHTGVSFHTNKGLSYWVASWRNLDGKLKSKCFNTKIGFEEAKLLAIEYRESKIKELNSQNAGYSERHGT